MKCPRTVVAFAVCTGLAAASQGSAATGEALSTVVPCDKLPPTAVRTVPTPFAQYMELTCTVGGQMLRPKDGFNFIFKEGAFWLSPLNPDNPAPRGDEHFTSLTAEPLSKAQIADLRAALHRISDSPLIDTFGIIKMREETSTGAHKQIVLLIPPEGSGVDAQGMECAKDCMPIESDPWFFAIVPGKTR